MMKSWKNRSLKTVGRASSFSRPVFLFWAFEFKLTFYRLEYPMAAIQALGTPAKFCRNSQQLRRRL